MSSKKIRKIFVAGIACLLSALACKKGNNDTGSGGNRIISINSPSFNHIYNYDAQNRLAGIDYSISSHMKAEYSASGIVLQWYDGANNPADHRMEMNLVKGRVQYVVETVGNYKNEHFYNYDTEGRMNRAQATRARIDNNQLQNKGEALFTWSNNQLTKVVHTVLDRDGIKTDSVIWDINYYDDKKFITWEDVGFSYFGKTPLAGMATGFGYRLPVTFLSEGIVPSVAPAKGITQKRYSYHAGQWQLSGNTSVYPENYYQYDAQGRLTHWLNAIEITWK